MWRVGGSRVQEELAVGTEAEEDDSVDALIRRLVEHAESSAGSRPSDAPDPEVILDVEVEGVRCLVVRPPEARSARTASLSPREREIARLVAAGHTNKTIAAVLDISSWTVSTHLRRIFAKLGVSSRAAMVARLLEHSAGGGHD